MKQAHFVAFVAAALAGAVVATLPVPALADDAVIAKLNGKEIRDSDLALAEAEIGPEIASLPPANRRRVLLEFLIETQLFADAADAENITSGADYEKRAAYWQMRAKRDTYFEKSVKGTVSDGLAKGIYDDKVKMIPPEEEVDARHILVETEAKANEVLEKIGKGEDFSALAALYSTDPGSKGEGGKLGYFSKGQMVKEFEEAAFALKKGEVSKPVKSKFGWHIIKLEDRRMRPLPSFEEVKPQIVQSIVQQKAQQTAKDLRGKANIEYVDSEIKTQVAQETEAAAQKQKAFEQQIDEQLKLEQQKKDEKK